MSEWDKYGDAAEKGPMAIFMKVFLLIVVMSVLISGTGYVFGWFGEAAGVARDEFGPKAALRKYEWFKDAAAQLQAKKKSIEVYEVRAKTLRDDYEGVARKDWDRTDKEQVNQWTVEVAGLKASYNSLAAEYNSASSKFNWSAFEGDTPHEFKVYETK